MRVDTQYGRYHLCSDEATLELKLRIISIRKLLQHNAAMYRPTTKQMPAAVVLARQMISSNDPTLMISAHASSALRIRG